MTLQDSITHLTTLAREQGVDILTHVQVEAVGVTLSVFWEGSGGEALPREANLFFGQVGDEDDAFSFAMVIEPKLFMWATDEGLSDEDAQQFALRMLESLDAVVDYFQGRPYKFAKPKSSKA